MSMKISFLLAEPKCLCVFTCVWTLLRPQSLPVYTPRDMYTVSSVSYFYNGHTPYHLRLRSCTSIQRSQCFSRLSHHHYGYTRCPSHSNSKCEPRTPFSRTADNDPVIRLHPRHQLCYDQSSGRRTTRSTSRSKVHARNWNGSRY